MSDQERPTVKLDRTVETGESAKVVAKLAALEKRVDALEAVARSAQEKAERPSRS